MIFENGYFVSSSGYLGVMQAPSGDEMPELEYLESKLKNGYLRSDRPHSDVKMLLKLSR